MDQRMILLLAAISIQGLLAAPNFPVTSSGASSEHSTKTDEAEKSTGLTNLPSNDAEFTQEFQRLKDSAEQFQQQILKFTTALSSKLNPGSSFQMLIDQVVATMKAQTVAYIKKVEEDEKAFLGRASTAANEGLRRGRTLFNSNLAYAQSTIEDLQKRGDQLFQSGVDYLRFIERILMTKLMDSVQASSTQVGETKRNDDGNQHLQRRDERPGFSSVVTQQLSGVRDSGTDMIKELAIVSTGSIIGILDALSAVLSSTSDVGHHAKVALREIRKSGTHAVNSVIDTTGSYVSGSLDKTGQLIDSMRIGPYGDHDNQQSNVNSDTSDNSHRALRFNRPAEPDRSSAGNDSGQSPNSEPSADDLTKDAETSTEDNKQEVEKNTASTSRETEDRIQDTAISTENTSQGKKDGEVNPSNSSSGDNKPSSTEKDSAEDKNDKRESLETSTAENNTNGNVGAEKMTEDSSAENKSKEDMDQNAMPSSSSAEDNRSNQVQNGTNTPDSSKESTVESDKAEGEGNDSH